MVEALPDADLRFGLTKNFDMYRQLAFQGTGVTDFGAQQIGGGLTAAARTGNMKSLGAIAIKGGVPTGDLGADITARIAGVHAQAECNAIGSFAAALNADLDYVGVFQSVYMLGDQYKRRMTALREDARSLAHLSDTDQTVTVARGGAAEVATWTGPGRVVATGLGQGTSPGEVDVFLDGFEPRDLAVDTTAQMKDEIEIVYGEPWVADCAARIRTSCPADFVNQYVIHPTDAIIWTDSSYPWPRLLGSDGTLVQYRFQSLDVANRPEFVGNTLTPKHLYVVARHDPRNPSAAGRVLGSLELRGDGQATEIQSSDDLRRHENATLGVSPSYTTRILGGGGDDTTASPPGFCIDGVTEQPFAPLENELTSDSDQYENSWKHYLSVAQQAATRADDLGQQLIRNGAAEGPPARSGGRGTRE